MGGEQMKKSGHIYYQLSTSSGYIRHFLLKLFTRDHFLNSWFLILDSRSFTHITNN